MSFFAGGFFYDPKRDRVLLHLRDRKAAKNPGRWAFFGGSSEGGESPVECFCREIREELGIRLSETDPKPLRSYLNPRTGRYHHVFVVAHAPPPEDIALREGAAVAWISAEEALQYDLTEGTRADLTVFLSQRASARSEAHLEAGIERPVIGLKRGAVELRAYTAEWRPLFEEEKARLQAVIGQYVLDIQHIGSTAIPGMIAKPIIDIGIAVLDFEETRVCIGPIEHLGYEYRGEFGIPRRHYFVKGDPRTHHIHMNEIESRDWRDQIVFRDYLIQHAELAKEYAELKAELTRRFPTDRDAYQDGKASFIDRVLRASRLQREIERKFRKRGLTTPQNASGDCPGDTPRRSAHGLVRFRTVWPCAAILRRRFCSRTET